MSTVETSASAHAAEGHRHDQHRQQQHEPDHQRQPAVLLVREVEGLRGATADGVLGAVGQVAERGRDELAAQLLDRAVDAVVGLVVRHPEQQRRGAPVVGGLDPVGRT